MDFSDKELSKFDFSISLVILFNPKLVPKTVKPSESDYQDTKLLFYFPDAIQPEEKRNQVGLVEGSFHFWDMFGDSFNENEATQAPASQILYLDDYIHILKEVEKDFWLFIVIKPLVPGNSIKATDAEYLNSQVLTFTESTFSEENCFKFISHFYQTFFLFHGSFTSYFSVPENTMRPEFVPLMKDYMKNYLLLNSFSGETLNLLKYDFTGVNYSPIDKKKFLSLQYLINIVQSIERNLEHFALFYSGYLIFSTFDQKDLQLLYDYFYVTNNACEIDQTKIINKFEKVKFEEKQGNYPFYGVINRPSTFPNGFLYGPVNLPDPKTINGNKNSDLIIFSPIISIFDPVRKSVVRHNLFAFFERNLLLLMTSNFENPIEKIKFIEIQNTIQANSEKLAQNMEKQLTKLASQNETFRMVYFNKMNLALKISNKISLSALDFETVKYIDEIKTELEKNNRVSFCLKKSVNFWIYGLKGNSRIVAFLIPGNVSFQKVEEEKEEIQNFFFSNIFI